MAWGGAFAGGYLTRSSSESPSAADVCSLSSTLETGVVPQRFYLSAKACSGILVRAGRRGKPLPEILQTALEKQAGV